MKKERKDLAPSATPFFVAAIFLSLLFWAVETVIEVYIFHLGKNFFQHLIFPTTHEMWMRFIVIVLTIVATLLFYYISRHRQVQKSLQQSEENYQKQYILQSTISSVLEQRLEPISLKVQLERILDLVLINPLFGEESKGCIFIFDDKSNTLKLEAQKRMPEGIETTCSSVHIGQCLCGKAAANRETIFTDEVDDRHEIHYHDITPHGQYSIPILSGDRLLGVLTFYVKTGHQRNKEEESFLSSIANAIAGVIERKKAEISLQASESRFRSLYDQATDSIFLMRPTKDDLIIEDANKAACVTHGYTREELLGASIGMLDDPETRKHIRERISLMLSGAPLNAEAMHVRKDGSLFPVEISAQLIHIGNKPYILAIDRDITRRMQNREKLLDATKRAEDEKAKLDAVIKGLGMGLIIQDLNYKVIYENEFQQNTIGNHVGELCYEAYEGKDHICEDCPMVISLQDGKIHKTERIIPTDEGERYYELISSPLKDSEGTIIGGIKAVQDMTERMRAEKEIVQSQELLTSIMDSLDSLVYVADMKTYEILFLNKHGRNIFGDITGRTCWQELQSGQTGPCDFCTNKFLIDADGRPAGVHTWEFQNSKNNHWYFIHDRAIPWTDGRLVRMEIATDITDRKNYEMELNERMELAELNADIGIALTTGATLQDSLQKCTESFVQQLDALFTRIWLFNEEENLLELKASAGLYTHLDGPHSRIPYGKYKIGTIAKDRTPHLTNRVSDDPLISDQEWVRKEKVVSFAGHPLMLKNRLIGVIAMFSRNVLSDISIKALSSVANQVAIGVDQKIKEEQVLKAKERWETTFDTIPDIVIVIDRNHKIMRANKALSERLGIDRDRIIDRPCYSVVHGTSEPPSFCPHTEVLADGKERVAEIYDKNLNGHFQFSATPILDSLGNVLATVHVARDITKRKQMEERLKEAAITDELTGLLNRRGFFALAEQQCKLSDRTKRGITLLFLDLDGMKTINDELGHSAGDRALKDVAILLKNSFRGSDIIARMGGDEFAVLLTEPSEKTEPAVVNHLMQNFVDHNENSGRDFELLISIGIAHYDPANPCSIEDMLIQADYLMYEDKISHKDIKPVSAGKYVSSKKRKYIRRFTHDCYIVHLSDQQGNSFEGIKIVNISAGGLCIETPDQLIKGRLYNMEIHCKKIKEIKAHVTVVWTSSEIADNGKEALNQFHAGLKFEAMDSSLQTRLAVFLEALSER